MRARQRAGTGVAYLILAVLALLTFYPLLLMAEVGFKDNAEFYSSFWLPLPPYHLENFTAAWGEIAPYLVNSVIVSGGSMIGVCIFSCLAGYAFARFHFPGREVLYYLVLAVMMVPSILMLVPLLVEVKTLGLLDTRWALILPYIAAGQALAIFIMRAFFAGLPEEMFEAARLDGAGELRALVSIALPLVKPVLGTVAIMQLLATWNDYVWPFVAIHSEELRTLVTGIVEFQARHFINWGPLMAGYTLAALPLVILFLFTVRYFMDGLMAGALKV
jgi:ABC-type glycerol-3-phosphate transport system permease component